MKIMEGQAQISRRKEKRKEKENDVGDALEV